MATRRPGRPAHAGPESVRIERVHASRVRYLKARVQAAASALDLTLSALAGRSGHAPSRLSVLLAADSLAWGDYEAICVALGIDPEEWLEPMDPGKAGGGGSVP